MESDVLQSEIYIANALNAGIQSIWHNLLEKLHHKQRENKSENSNQVETGNVSGEVKQLVFGANPRQSDGVVVRLLKKEQEYQKLLNGSDTLDWLRRHREEKEIVSRIISSHGLSLIDYDLLSSDWQLILNVMNGCPLVKGFKFSKGLKSLVKEIQNINKPKLHIQNLHYCGPLGADEVKNLIEFAKSSNASSLTLESRKLNKKAFFDLKKGLQELKRQRNSEEEFKLTLARLNSIPSEGLQCVAEILQIFDGTPVYLALINCGLEDESLQTFKTYLSGLKVEVKLKGIDISQNHKLTKYGFKTFGEIVKSSQASSVGMSYCQLDEEKLDAFVEGANEAQVETLNLNGNRSLNKKSKKGKYINKFEQINKVIEGLKVNKLSLADCAMKTFQLTTSIDILDVSYNSHLKCIGNIVKKVKKEFHACECLLLKSDLEELSKSLKSKKKLKHLCICDTYKQIDGSLILLLASKFKTSAEKITVHYQGADHILLFPLQRSLKKLARLEISVSPCVKLVSGSNKDCKQEENRISVRSGTNEHLDCVSKV